MFSRLGSILPLQGHLPIPTDSIHTMCLSPDGVTCVNIWVVPWEAGCKRMLWQHGTTLVKTERSAGCQRRQSTTVGFMIHCLMCRHTSSATW